MFDIKLVMVSGWVCIVGKDWLPFVEERVKAMMLNLGLVAKIWALALNSKPWPNCLICVYLTQLSVNFWHGIVNHLLIFIRPGNEVW